MSRHRVRVVPPYRLDLTISALRRLSTNVVDRLTSDGQYLRALGRSPRLLVAVRQVRPDALVVTIEGRSSEHARALATVRRMLATERDLRRFARSAARIPWLAPLARRMRGVKPPRYPTLWEACVNAVVFQQLSVVAASAITGRLVAALGRPVMKGTERLYAFPSARSLLAASDDQLRATGLSAGKLATLRRVATELLSSRLDESMLEGRSSEEAALILRRVKGIGPWSAALILLRGLGRLDVFPLTRYERRAQPRPRRRDAADPRRAGRTRPRPRDALLPPSARTAGGARRSRRCLRVVGTARGRKSTGPRSVRRGDFGRAIMTTGDPRCAGQRAGQYAT